MWRHPVTAADVCGLATAPLLTVLLCARDLAFDDALAVADSALRHGDVDPDDLVGPIRGIVLEADSWGFHASRGDHERDCVRYNALTATGWRVLRFAWDHVMFSQPYVSATIRAMLLESVA